MTQRRFHLSKFVVWALLLSTAAAAVAGTFAMFETDADARAVLFRVCVFAAAGVAASALAVSQAAAGAVQVLRGKPEYRVAFWLAVACAIVCGFVSVGGVHLCAGVLKGHVQTLPDDFWITIGGFALGGVKPAMGVVLEACEQVAAADFARASADAAEADWKRQETSREADRLSAERRAAASAPQAPQPAPEAPALVASTPGAKPASAAKPAPSKRATEASARAAAKALRDAPMRAPAKTPQPVERTQAPGQPLTEAELQAAVAELVAQHGHEGPNVVSLRRVAAQAQIMLGRPVPATQVERHPMRREVFQAAKLRLAS